MKNRNDIVRLINRAAETATLEPQRRGAQGALISIGCRSVDDRLKELESKRPLEQKEMHELRYLQMWKAPQALPDLHDIRARLRTSSAAVEAKSLRAIDRLEELHRTVEMLVDFLETRLVE
jgi:hypothetical protein